MVLCVYDSVAFSSSVDSFVLIKQIILQGFRTYEFIVHRFLYGERKQLQFQFILTNEIINQEKYMVNTCTAAINIELF